MPRMNVLYADTRLGGTVKWVYGDPREIDMHVPDELIDSVCFLCTKEGGEYIYGGTAFFLSYVSASMQQQRYIVTARHCIEAIQELGGDVCLRINTEDGGAKVLTVKEEWIFPKSEAVDVAILPIDFPRDCGLRFDVIPHFNLVTDEMSLNLGPGEDLLITGLFTMRHGTQRNHPIVRAGILAATLGEQLEDGAKGGYDAYLAEVRSIGGLSGSPVFVVYRPDAPARRDVLAFSNRDGEPPASPGGYYLLGLIRGHWDEKKGPLKPAFANDMEEVNMGIAVVTPASDLAQLLDSDHVRDDRRRRELERRAERAPTPD